MIDRSQLLQQIGQCHLHRIPNDVQIDVEVTMRDAVAHPPHGSPWHFWVGLSELALAIHKATGIGRGLLHVRKVISQPALTHTGRASAST